MITAPVVKQYFYCRECKADADAEITASITGIYYPVKVQVEVTAACTQCKSVLVETEDIIVLQE